jgi:16S rRNA (guanine527-N7)-methyltransferase
MTTSLASLLQEGCQQLGLSPTTQQNQKLIAYVELIAKWNKVYNLTSIREPKEMMTRHIIDSLSVLPYFECDSLLDVGTGGGMPGIPIAIMQPQTQVTLLDSNSKKTRFLQQVKAELGLNNVEVVHARVEEANVGTFDIVTARAFATIANIIALAGKHCNDAGSLVLMKGQYPDQELNEITGDFHLKEVIELDVPYSDGQRHLVTLVKE